MSQVLIFTGAPEYTFIRPIGAYQVASRLREHGYKVQVVEDFPILATQFSLLLDVISKFVDESTLWIGFSTTFFIDLEDRKRTKAAVLQDNLVLSKEKLIFLKSFIHNINPNVKIVLGGSKSWILTDDFVDCYIEGYADDSAIAYTKWLEGKNPFLTFRPNNNGSMSVINDRTASRFNFANHKFSWHETDYISQGEALPIEISRGCIFKCKFCSYPLNGKKKMDFIKDPVILYDELMENYDRFKTKNYVFVDDTFNDSPEKLEILYNKVFSRLPFKIKFGAYLRLDLLRAHPHTIDLLRDSGIATCFFGIESMNNQTNKLIGKGIKVEKLVETLHTAREKWSETYMVGGFIIGLPYDSEESVIKWATELADPNFPLDTVGLEALNIFPTKKDLDAVWINELELNPEKYGYTFLSNTEWVNNMGLSRKRAQEIRIEMYHLYKANDRLKYKWTTPFGLHNIGVSNVFGRNVNLEKFPEMYYDSLRKMQFQIYIKKLLG